MSLEVKGSAQPTILDVTVNTCTYKGAKEIAIGTTRKNSTDAADRRIEAKNTHSNRREINYPCEGHLVPEEESKRRLGGSAEKVGRKVSLPIECMQRRPGPSPPRLIM